MNGDIERSLGRVEGKLDALLLQLTEHIKKDESEWAKVSKLSTKMAWYSGAFAVIGAVSVTVLRKMGILA